MEVYSNWKLLKFSINLLNDVHTSPMYLLLAKRLKVSLKFRNTHVLREEVERRTMCVLPVFLNHRPNQLFT